MFENVRVTIFVFHGFLMTNFMCRYGFNIVGIGFLLAAVTIRSNLLMRWLLWAASSNSVHEPARTRTHCVGVQRTSRL